MGVRGLLGVVLFAASCFRPTPPDGVACTTTRECPTSLVCAEGLCVSEAQSPDAPGTDASGTGDAATCTPIVNGAGALIAPRASITLDGQLDDWSACFVTLDTSTALIREENGGGMFASGRFSIAHDDKRIYIAAEVQGVAPLGDHAEPQVYKNDSISLYLDADGVFQSDTYDPDAAQIVIDHANRIGVFHATSPLPNLASFARTVNDTFTIEIAIEPSTLNASAFASTIGFDIGFEGGDGVDQTSELLWFSACGPPDCVCSNGDSAPYCDARQFGTATLAP